MLRQYKDRAVGEKKYVIIKWSKFIIYNLVQIKKYNQL